MTISNTIPGLKWTTAILIILSSITALLSCTKSDQLIETEEHLSSTQPSPAVTISKETTLSEPFESYYYVPCANGGEGEEVLVKGNITTVITRVINNNRVTLSFHWNPQNASGVGLTTGDLFAVSGGSQGTLSGNLVNDQFTYTTTEQLRIVGTGATFIVRYKFRVTVLANGEYVTSMSDEEVICN